MTHLGFHGPHISIGPIATVPLGRRFSAACSASVTTADVASAWLSADATTAIASCIGGGGESSLSPITAAVFLGRTRQTASAVIGGIVVFLSPTAK